MTSLLAFFCHAAALRGALAFSVSTSVAALGASALVSTNCKPTAAKSAGLVSAFALRGRAGRLLSALAGVSTISAAGLVVTTSMASTLAATAMLALAGLAFLPSGFALTTSLVDALVLTSLVA